MSAINMILPELWSGVVELKPLNRAEYGAAGAFTNIVTWARDAQEFRTKADAIAATLSMYVAQVENVEPVGKSSDGWHEEFEDMVRRAETNPNAIIYGTFHTYPHDQA
jgi:hypothetical protein